MREPLARLRQHRWWSVLVFVVAVALAAAGLRVSEAEPDHQRLAGLIGQQIGVEDGWVHVSDLRVGDALAEDGDVTRTTVGLFVVVRITVASSGPQEVSFGETEVVTANRTYANYSQFLGRAEPGFRVTEDATFEVDPSHIDDLTVRLQTFAFVRGYDQQVEVHLGIIAENAEQWRAAGRGQSVEPLPDAKIEGIP